MEAYSIADLKPTGAFEYRTVGTGIFFINRNGRRVEKTVGAEYVPIGKGKIEKDKWYRLMEAAVDRENQGQLLMEIEEACKRFAWLKTDEDRHRHALEVLGSKAYLYWPEWKEAVFIFFPFTVYAGGAE